MFNMINTYGSPLTITGISQGSYGNYFGSASSYNIYYYPGSYVPQIGNANGWVSLATNASGTVSSGGTPSVPVYSGAISITPVVIPAGATYGFYLGINGTLTYSIASGTVGVTPWGSNGALTITVGDGGDFPTPLNSTRAPLIKVYYEIQPWNSITYQWSNGATTEDLTGVAPGTYTVTATDCNGCTVSGTAEVGVAVGLNEESLNAVYIHPNPANEILYFSKTVDKVELFDLHGRIVKTTVNTDHIDVNYLAAGTYSIRLMIKDAVTVHRFVKE
jgi:hypothetical protein